MNILLATEVIHPGGAETFVLRLAKALKQKGHNVLLFSFYKNLYDAQLHKSIAPEIDITWPKISAQTISQKVDSLLFRTHIDRSFRGANIKQSLREIVKENNIDVIHSNLLKVDTICTEVGAELNVPVITTIHGDYLQFYYKDQNNIPIPLLNYEEKAKRNLERLKQVVCISDKQINFFREIFPNETNNKLTKIYNGYSGAIPNNSVEAESELGIRDNEFVFGMASRGIKEKGWEVAIEAFLALNVTNAHLVLVGGGDYMDELKNKYTTHQNIHFIGHSNEPLKWLNIIDVGLLPSTYASESLPTVVIEYLYCGKPVIASDVGEIKHMITVGNKTAGIILPILNNEVSVTDLKNAMQSYITDKVLYDSHKANTAECFAQFDMEKCIENYTQVYTNAIADNKRVRI